VLSRKLAAAGIAHRVLNARQDKEEAEIVASAGMAGQVTVATNMAGRGTDIPLGEGVAERGGLHVVAACRNDAKRIDRQLYGRCGRQGDPGSHQAILSLEDDLLQRAGLPGWAGFLKRRWPVGNRVLEKVHLYLIRGAQRTIERRHRDQRHALLQSERRTGRLLAFSGPME
jgi:preprotein translocase subunit SecA